jgi:phenylacetate-CoA ligase
MVRNSMAFDEKMRWFGFWALDGIRGGKVRRYYNQIQNSFKNGTSIRDTEEKIKTDRPCGAYY